MQTMDIKDEVFVDEYTGGLVGPGLGFAATIRDGGRIRCVVPPGCWGPMITAEASVRVNIIKNLSLDGPILLPVAEDLPFIARPFSNEELEASERLAHRYHVQLQRNVGPLQFIGTGPTLNEATDNAMKRASQVLQMTLAEVRNRCTITGGVEIGRLPGVVQLTMLVPLEKLDAIGPYIRQQYNL